MSAAQEENDCTTRGNVVPPNHNITIREPQLNQGGGGGGLSCSVYMDVDSGGVLPCTSKQAILGVGRCVSTGCGISGQRGTVSQRDWVVSQRDFNGLIARLDGSRSETLTKAYNKRR